MSDGNSKKVVASSSSAPFFDYNDLDSGITDVFDLELQQYKIVTSSSEPFFNHDDLLSREWAWNWGLSHPPKLQSASVTSSSKLFVFFLFNNFIKLL